MITMGILIGLALLIIFSYLFDVFSKKAKLPAVILLLLTGIILRFVTSFNGFGNFDYLDEAIPVLGTLGLILVVLEEAMHLKLSVEKKRVIGKGFIAAFSMLLFNVAAVSLIFYASNDLSARISVLLAIPLAIISSAVAIPSAEGLSANDKEFVIYESTFSDILGIMLFNYILGRIESSESLLGFSSIVGLLFQLLGVVVLSLAVTYLLFYLIQKINYRIKFFLLLAILILVYAIGKSLHLPVLVTIFIFGLFLANLKRILPDFLKAQLNLKRNKRELKQFKLLTAESTFLIKTLFFLFFGFSITLEQLANLPSILYGLIIVAAIYLVRYVYFLFPKFETTPPPLFFMAPRGLITILLFFQIQESNLVVHSKMDEGLLLIVILSTMLIMVAGLVLAAPKKY